MRTQRLHARGAPAVSTMFAGGWKDLMRKGLTLVHRYAGLAMAMFLIAAGLTGSILVWHEEIDGALNPRWFHAQSDGPTLSIPALIAAFERQAPEAEISFIRLPVHEGRSVEASMSGWTDPARPGVRINRVFLDPATGDILGVRSTVEPSALRAGEIIPWLYRFHYSLTLGSTGSYLMGFAALAWLIDTFVAFYLTLPRGKSVWSRPFWSKWKPAWGIKKKRLNFDLHRASGLWFLPVLFVLALSGVYLNLNDEVFRPVVHVFSPTTDPPYKEPALSQPVREPALSWGDAIARAEADMDASGREHAGVAYMNHSAARAYYTVSFRTARDLAPDRSGARIYVDSRTGEIRHREMVGEGTAGDILMEWQFPLHSGHAFGLAGRIIIFVAGLVITALSVTGIIIWLRKRRARMGIPRAARRPGGAPAGTSAPSAGAGAGAASPSFRSS